MKKLRKIYDNLNVMIEDDKEREDFKAMFDMVMEDYSSEFIVVAHILYSFGKRQGRKAEAARTKKAEERRQ